MDTVRVINNVIQGLSALGTISTDKQSEEGFSLIIPQVEIGENIGYVFFSLRSFIKGGDAMEMAKVIDRVAPKIMLLPNLTNRQFLGEETSIVVDTIHYKDDDDKTKIVFSFTVEQRY